VGLSDKGYTVMLLATESTDAFVSLALSGASIQAKTLYDACDDIDVRIGDDVVFRNRAANGDLAFLQWLLEADPSIDIHAANDDAYVSALHRRQYHVVAWLEAVDMDYPWHVVWDETIENGDDHGSGEEARHALREHVDMAKLENEWAALATIWVGKKP
jgi:hypothetical protein